MRLPPLAPSPVLSPAPSPAIFPRNATTLPPLLLPQPPLLSTTLPSPSLSPSSSPLAAPSPAPSKISQPLVKSPAPSKISQPLVKSPAPSSTPVLHPPAKVPPPRPLPPTPAARHRYPPPTAHLSPPPPPPPPRRHGGSGLSTKEGVLVGGAVMFVMIVVMAVCYRKRKKRDYEIDIPLKSDRTSPPPSGNLFDPQPLSLKSKFHPLEDHVMPMHWNMFPQPSRLSNTEYSYSSFQSRSDQNLLSPKPFPLGFRSSGNFTIEELAAATGSFSAENLLGEGGFGYVYKGFLSNGRTVAIKRLKIGSRQGDREFQAEVETISRVHHKHLVSMVGYCMTGPERLLVYEFLPNKTLEFHLHGKGQPAMEWETRVKIAIGSAKGLAYLHEDCNPTIIHRDIKASNILLDSKFEAKVADFGLAKFFSDTNHDVTHVYTRVVGTFGYLAPEYAASGRASSTSDVFSYGVVLLELITGREPLNTSDDSTDDCLVAWARPSLRQVLEEGSFHRLVDPRLQSNYNREEMARMVACAAACVRSSEKLRPQMSKIIRILEGNASVWDLDEGIRPGRSLSSDSLDTSYLGSRLYRVMTDDDCDTKTTNPSERYHW